MFWDTVISLVAVAIVVLIFWKMPDDEEVWAEDETGKPSDGATAPVASAPAVAAVASAPAVAAAPAVATTPVAAAADAPKADAAPAADAPKPDAAPASEGKPAPGPGA